jgi:phosphoketolase
MNARLVSQVSSEDINNKVMEMEDVKIQVKTLSPELLRKMNAYWKAANYLSVGQIYLYGNPLLKEPLTLEHIKPRLLGHWGITPGLNFPLFMRLQLFLITHS